MSTARRGFFSRIGIHRLRVHPRVVERFDLRINNDDTVSIRTILPAYSPRSGIPNRPPSPAPTYYTVDERETSPAPTIHPNVADPDPEINPQSVIDGLVSGIRESFKNSKSWHVLDNRE